MKNIASLLFAVFIFVWVSGYTKSNGTYVSGHYRSRANAYKYDNYSYTGGNAYNSSYYSGKSYNSNWNTPSYGDSDYYTGLSSYRSRQMRTLW